MFPADLWKKLRTAYGSAENIPALLERARHAPPGSVYTDEPWFSLWSALCHQGDVYTGSYAAVTVLVDIAAKRENEPAVLRECLLLAAFIELERASPEYDKTPPPVPMEIETAYWAALKSGATLAESYLARGGNTLGDRDLQIARAALRGDVGEARRLEMLEEQ
jgi:hypothetical protein